jgi:spore coat polysaccharide biosynthesis predicted glycosyltransferase SpsG
MKIIIRVDGNEIIGLGHLTRCTALAEILRNVFKIVFVFKEAPEFNVSSIKKMGFDTVKIELEENWHNMINPGDIIVLDGYQFDVEDHIQLKNLGAKLVCIDDLHDKPFDADLIINHAPGIKKTDYVAKEYTNFALGVEYSLLRSEFLSAAKNKRKIKDEIQNAFVWVGGADFKSISEKVVKPL